MIHLIFSTLPCGKYPFGNTPTTPPRKIRQNAPQQRKYSQEGKRYRKFPLGRIFSLAGSPLLYGNVFLRITPRGFTHWEFIRTVVNRRKTSQPATKRRRRNKNGKRHPRGINCKYRKDAPTHTETAHPETRNACLFT